MFGYNPLGTRPDISPGGGLAGGHYPRGHWRGNRVSDLLQFNWFIVKNGLHPISSIFSTIISSIGKPDKPELTVVKCVLCSFL